MNSYPTILVLNAFHLVSNVSLRHSVLPAQQDFLTFLSKNVLSRATPLLMSMNNFSVLCVLLHVFHAFLQHFAPNANSHMCSINKPVSQKLIAKTRTNLCWKIMITILGPQFMFILFVLAALIHVLLAKGAKFNALHVQHRIYLLNSCRHVCNSVHYLITKRVALAKNAIVCA